MTKNGIPTHPLTVQPQACNSPVIFSNEMSKSTDERLSGWLNQLTMSPHVRHKSPLVQFVALGAHVGSTWNINEDITRYHFFLLKLLHGARPSFPYCSTTGSYVENGANRSRAASRYLPRHTSRHISKSLRAPLA